MNEPLVTKYIQIPKPLADGVEEWADQEKRSWKKQTELIIERAFEQYKAQREQEQAEKTPAKPAKRG